MLSATPALTPGSCVGGFDWDVTVVAVSQSTLAGVLAGFVFGGIVVVLSVRVEAGRSHEAASALKLLFSAFFGLAVVAYLLADLTGDKNCLRATSQETLSGGILGTFAIIMMVSLTWLIVAYDRHARGVLRFLHHLIYVASAFVVLLLCTSSFSYLQAEVPGGPPSAISILIYLVGALLYLIAIPARLHIARVQPARIAPMPRSADNGSAVLEGTLQEEHSPVDRCAWAALGYLAAAAIADAFVLSLSGTAWDGPRVPVAYTVAWSSLLLPVGVLDLALLSMAPDQPLHGGTGPQPPISPAHPKEPMLTADVDQELLRERFETYIVDHYTGLHNTVVSVVLAVAGLSAVSLAGSHAQYGRSYPLLWLFWLASLLLCATIFAGTMSGSVAIPPQMPAVADLLIPLLLGVGESVMFGTLARQVTGLNTTSAVAEAWFISLAVVCTCATAAITRAMRSYDAATYSPEISGIIDGYRLRRLPVDRTSALTIVVIGIGGAVASAVHLTWLEYGLAGCAVMGLSLALHGHARSATILRAALHKTRTTGTVESQPQKLRRTDSSPAPMMQETGTGWPELPRISIT